MASLTEIDSKDLKRIPGPLYTLIELINIEKNEFRRIHRLIDAFEWAVKWHTVIAVSDILQESEIPSKIKVLLAGGLRTPSLGMWNMFFREAVAVLEKPSVPYNEWERLTELEKKYQIVAFRNSYAHGATPSDEECMNHFNKMYPVLLKMINSPLFTEVKLVVSEGEEAVILQGDNREKTEIKLKEGSSAAVLSGGQFIELWPLGICTQSADKWDYFYFNAVKGNKIEQLNYEKALLLRDKNLWEPFNEKIPIKEWSKVENEELEVFKSRIDTLIEDFKGRTEERKEIRQFCLNGSGTMFIWGGPGIGKSALLAKTITEIKGGVDPEGSSCKDKYPDLIEYFIRQGTGSDNPEYFLRYLNMKLDSLFGLSGTAIGNNTIEMYEKQVERIAKIESMDKKKEIILFIDGLDECPDIAGYIPPAAAWMKIIVSSRPVEKIKEWSRKREKEKKLEVEVGALKISDIRAMLYDSANKYQDGFNSEYLEQIRDRSQGNPLYLKLLCEKIYDNKGILPDIKEIPAGIKDLYIDTLKRITDSGNNKNALDLLVLLAVALKPLDLPLIGEFLGLNGMQVQSAVDTCRELLIEDPLNEEKEVFQLFHESLRDWLKETQKSEFKNMSIKIADICYDYKSLVNESALKYSLENCIDHLSSVNDSDRLWNIISDDKFREKQKETFGRYNEVLASFRTALRVFVKNSGKNGIYDEKLSWCALGAASISDTAKSESEIVFEQVQKKPLTDINRVSDVLKTINVLGDKDYLLYSVILLALELELQGKNPDRANKDFIRIIKALTARIPVEKELIEGMFDIPAEFIIRLIKKTFTLFPETDAATLFSVLTCSEYNIQRILEQLLKSTTEEKDLIDPLIKLVKQRVSEIPDKIPSIRNLIIYILENKRYEDALGLAELISDTDEREYCRLVIAEAMAENGHYDDSIGLIRKSRDKKSADDLCKTSAIRELKKGSRDKAELFLKNISGKSAAAAAYSEAASLFFKTDINAGIIWYLKASEILESIKDKRLYDESNNKVLQNLNSIEIDEQGISDVSADLLNKITGKRGEYLFDLLKSVLDVLLNIKDTDKAVSLTYAVEESYLRDKLLYTAALYALSENKTRAAEEILESINASRFKCSIFSKIACKHIKNDNFSLGIKILKKTLSYSDDLNVGYMFTNADLYNPVFELLLKKNRIEEANEFVDNINHIFSLFDISNAFSSNRDNDVYKSFIEHIFKKANEISEESGDMVGFSELYWEEFLKALLKAPSFAGKNEYFSKMFFLGLRLAENSWGYERLNELESLTAVLEEAEDIEDKEILYEKCIDFALNYNKDETKTEALKLISSSAVRKGNLYIMKKIVKIFESIFEAPYKSNLLLSVSSDLMEHDKISAANDLFLRIVKKQDEWQQVRSLLEFYIILSDNTKNTQFEDTELQERIFSNLLSTAEEAVSAQSKKAFLSLIIDNSFKIHSDELKKTVIARVEKITDTVLKESFRNILYSDLVRFIISQEGCYDAEEIEKQTALISEKINEAKQKYKAYLSIAEYYIGKGDLEKFQGLINESDDHEFLFEAYLLAGRYFAENGKISEAEDNFSKSLDEMGIILGRIDPEVQDVLMSINSSDGYENEFIQAAILSIFFSCIVPLKPFEKKTKLIAKSLEIAGLIYDDQGIYEAPVTGQIMDYVAVIEDYEEQSYLLNTMFSTLKKDRIKFLSDLAESFKKKEDPERFIELIKDINKPVDRSAFLVEYLQKTDRAILQKYKDKITGLITGMGEIRNNRGENILEFPSAEESDEESADTLSQNDIDLLLGGVAWTDSDTEEIIEEENIDDRNDNILEAEEVFERDNKNEQSYLDVKDYLDFEGSIADEKINFDDSIDFADRLKVLADCSLIFALLNEEKACRAFLGTTLETVNTESNENEKVKYCKEILTPLSKSGNINILTSAYSFFIDSAAGFAKFHKSVIADIILPLLDFSGPEKTEFEILDKITELAVKNDFVKKISSSLLVAAGKLLISGYPDKALDIFSNKDIDREILDFRLLSAVKKSVECGNTEGAFMLTRRITDKKQLSEALEFIGEGYIKQEKPERADSIIKRIPHPVYASSLNLKTAEYYFEKAFNDEGLDYLKKGLLLAEGYKEQVLTSIKKIQDYLLKTENPSEYINFLNMVNLPAGITFESIIFWHKKLMEYEKTDIGLIRESFNIFPFETGIAKICVLSLLLFNINSNQNTNAENILKLCSGQLELVHADSAGAGDIYNYESLEAWIDNIDDEDDADQIELWARKVKKGKLSPDEFTSKVKELLE